MIGGAERAVVLTNPEYQLPAPGRTFAGRDVFAPAAAHLCNGVDLTELGDAHRPDLLSPGSCRSPAEEDGALVAEVLWVDRFGNAQLNVDPDEIAALGERIALRFGEHETCRVRSEAYAALGPGELGLVVDSYGLLSLCRRPALRRRRAAGRGEQRGPPRASRRSGEGPQGTPVAFTAMSTVTR